jgi:hypothetical protein
MAVGAVDDDVKEGTEIDELGKVAVPAVVDVDGKEEQLDVFRAQLRAQQRDETLPLGERHTSHDRPHGIFPVAPETDATRLTVNTSVEPSLRCHTTTTTATVTATATIAVTKLGVVVITVTIAMTIVTMIVTIIGTIAVEIGAPVPAPTPGIVRGIIC